MFGRPNSAAIAFGAPKPSTAPSTVSATKPGTLAKKPGQPTVDHHAKAKHHLGKAAKYAGSPKGALAVHLKLAQHHMHAMGGMAQSQNTGTGDAEPDADDAMENEEGET